MTNLRVALVSPLHGSGGFRKYLEELPPRLGARLNLSTFVPEPVEAAFAHQNFVTYLNRSDLRAKLADHRPDVVFVPTSRSLRWPDVPQVTMVRNMEPLTRPVRGLRAYEATRNLLRIAITYRACRSSDRIIAVSEHVRDRLLTSHWGLSPDKVVVVYHGASQPSSEVSRPEAAPDEPFLFTAGSLRPARGLEDVLHAMHVLSKSTSSPKLLVAGSPDPATRDYADRMMALTNKLALEDRVIWGGRLGSREMSWCYRNALALVITSRTEACPNVALEAMSAGCAIVSSDCDPMPEFLESAAIYYRAEDPASLAGALAAVLTDSARLGDLQSKAARRALAFDWEDTADRTADVLKQAAAT